MIRRPRPDTPRPGQESVCDYPRPPALERDERLVEVRFGGEVVASTTSAYRVLETSHPPGCYLPFTVALNSIQAPRIWTISMTT